MGRRRRLAQGGRRTARSAPRFGRRAATDHRRLSVGRGPRGHGGVAGQTRHWPAVDSPPRRNPRPGGRIRRRCGHRNPVHQMADHQHTRSAGGGNRCGMGLSADRARRGGRGDGRDEAGDTAAGRAGGEFHRAVRGQIRRARAGEIPCAACGHRDRDQCGTGLRAAGGPGTAGPSQGDRLEPPRRHRLYGRGGRRDRRARGRAAQQVRDEDDAARWAMGRGVEGRGRRHRGRDGRGRRIMGRRSLGQWRGLGSAGAHQQREFRRTRRQRQGLPACRCRIRPARGGPIRGARGRRPCGTGRPGGRAR